MPVAGNIRHIQETGQATIGNYRHVQVTEGGGVLPDVALTSRKLLVKLEVMASDPPSLGMRIRRARERRHLTQPELAEAVGVSVRALGDWERDRHEPKSRLGALEEVLGVNLTGEQDAFSPATPDEAAIWSFDRFSEDERRALIQALRDMRDH